jgi:hypothetical protein
LSASKAAIDIMPTPEPIATPVPVNAQRERIESDAYIAVEELIFADFFSACFVVEKIYNKKVSECSRVRRKSESAETKIIKNHRRRERGKARDPKIVLLALESRASRGESSVLFPNSGRLFLFFLSLSFDSLLLLLLRRARRDTANSENERTQTGRKKKDKKKGETAPRE